MELANKLNYPSSGYKVKAITGFKIYIYYRNHALGDSEAVIPKIIRDNKHVITFPKTNNKCVFHCIAWHLHKDSKRDPRKIQAQVKDVFKRYRSFKGIAYTLNLFRGFKPLDLLQFDELEDCFQFAINVYKMDVASGEVEWIRRSDKEHESINILSHENHALYIKSIDMLQSKYQCAKCEMIFVSSVKLRDHAKNQCERINIETFPTEPTIYKPPQNTIRSLLTKYSIKNTDNYIDHFIVYEFEAILKPTATQHGENTVFTNEHIPVSVSIADSMTEEVRCFVNADPKALHTDMFKYIADVVVEIQKYNVQKYETLLRKIINAYGLTGKYSSFFNFHSSLGFSKKRSDYDKLKQQLDQVPVFGFNSGPYDINLIKSDLFAVIGTDNIKSAIKNPSYMCIATSDMKMLDISNYVPAGTSYDKYLTTYLGGCKCDGKVRCICGLGKGLFPYEYITSFNVLIETQIPPKAAFDSKLRGTSISNDEYERVKWVWEYYDMKTIKDLLVWYNNLDVVPFIKAIKSQRELFKRFDLDMFVDGVSLPGLSEKVMYQACFDNLKYPSRTPAKAFQFPAKRMSGYKKQDAESKREFGMTLDHLDMLLQKQKSGMDMSKHKEVKYESDQKAIESKIEHFTFHGLEELNDACEITMKKRRLKNKNPIHLSIAIYQLAKLRMLQFYYDCIDFYFDRSDFEYQEMDTDSAYTAFSCDNPFQDCIKSELRDHFKQHKYDWFPRDYNKEVAKFDRRTPGLFKDEWSGDAMVSWSSKNYICYLPDESYKVKVSAKGVQQGRGRNEDVLNPNGFETVVRDRITLQGTNKGFRL
ncbi:hypothetical protein PC110_g11683 [Phytophthora cactorum]|uniref:C2H2-type domain-containing protein n=1 Tax=Phytophthora cactorum TaxID=29920 RepID=A0A329S548_9STRA|nr:hypothetical protein PC110_g11683 [Phytophthora cactorum]